MNKIKTKVSRETNFIYHMLSVAKCGYDNEYGNQYATIHMPEDLGKLKVNESLITVSGGEHCGKLYWILVSIPSSLDIEAPEYYKLLHDLFTNNNAKTNIIKFEWLYNIFLSVNEDDLIKMVSNTLIANAEYKTVIVRICDVMIRNYPIYCGNVWKKSLEVLLPYSKIIDDIFSKNNLTDRLDSFTGYTMKSEFTASFCNSIDGGAEAIDISDTQDVFGIGREYEWAEKFISHEYVIYLLKQALFGTSAFSSIKYWAYTECLAEFYLSRIIGETGAFKKHQFVIDFYNKKYDENKDLTPSNLYQMAVETFI